jgi:hypothetical protein
MVHALHRLQSSVLQVAQFSGVLQVVPQVEWVLVLHARSWHLV